MPREPTPLDQRWWLRLLPSPIPRPADSRVSIRSIRARDAKTFFRVATLLWLAALMRVGYKRHGQPPHDDANGVDGWLGFGDLALATLSDFSVVATGIAVVAMLATRPLNFTGEILMSLYQAMVNRFVIPVIEAHRAEGRAEGRAETQTRWQVWNRRRLEAERQGREFAEPPPELRP